jgi:hypothetical protein
MALHLQWSRLMLKTMLIAAATAGILAVGVLPLDLSPAQAAQMTCREAAKLKYPSQDLKGRFAFRRACKAAWKAHKLNPQPLPPKA